MDAGIPVMEVKRGIGGVALEADQRLGRRGQGLQVDQGFVVTCRFYAFFGILRHQFPGQAFYGKAARSMTGFAVNERQAGFLFQLRPHGAGIKVFLQPVMRMAGRKAIGRTHIVGIKPADDHFFVFLDRQNGFGPLQSVAAAQGAKKRNYEQGKCIEKATLEKYVHSSGFPLPPLPVDAAFMAEHYYNYFPTILQSCQAYFFPENESARATRCCYGPGWRPVVKEDFVKKRPGGTVFGLS
ncbi:hypothetical protein BMS3Abin13_00028 [bacterium BMS3Abin13]|nr:hypothetical protein BMS3Abin13_00028 [bacterium BMS3Abin13]